MANCSLVLFIFRLLILCSEIAIVCGRWLSRKFNQWNSERFNGGHTVDGAAGLSKIFNSQKSKPHCKWQWIQQQYRTKWSAGAKSAAIDLWNATKYCSIQWIAIGSEWRFIRTAAKWFCDNSYTGKHYVSILSSTLLQWKHTKPQINWILQSNIYEAWAVRPKKSRLGFPYNQYSFFFN